MGSSDGLRSSIIWNIFIERPGFRMMSVKLGSHCQLDCIYNHHRSTPPVCMGDVTEGEGEGEGSYLLTTDTRGTLHYIPRLSCLPHHGVLYPLELWVKVNWSILKLLLPWQQEEYWIQWSLHLPILLCVPGSGESTHFKIWKTLLLG